MADDETRKVGRLISSRLFRDVVRAIAVVEGVAFPPPNPPPSKKKNNVEQLEEEEQVQNEISTKNNEKEEGNEEEIVPKSKPQGDGGHEIPVGSEGHCVCYSKERGLELILKKAADPKVGCPTSSSSSSYNTARRAGVLFRTRSLLLDPGSSQHLEPSSSSTPAEDRMGAFIGNAKSAHRLKFIEHNPLPLTRLANAHNSPSAEDLLGSRRSLGGHQSLVPRAARKKKRTEYDDFVTHFKVAKHDEVYFK